jgi:tetratricopeptide (TPR) repeat protein
MALDLLRRLAVHDPGDAAAQDRLSRADFSVGEVLRDLRRPQDAVAHYRSARDVRSNLSKRFPEDRVYARGLVDVQISLFDLLRHTGDADSALVEYQSARMTLEKLLAQFPDDDGLLELFFDSQAGYGEFLNDQGKPAASVEAFTRAIDRLDQWATQNSKQTAANEHLRRCLMGRAQAYAVLQNPTRALRDADRAILLSPPSERQEVRASRPGLRITTGDVSGAVADVDQLARSDGWTASQWYGFACVNALASTRLPSQGQELSRRAIDHLNKAVKSGFKDVAHSRRDPDLDPLRARADFQKWLEELELLAPRLPVQ